MYAVVDSGGKQYRVEPGKTLVIDRLSAEAGATVTFDRVLLIGDDDGVTVGTPTVSGASVRATVVEHGRGPKIIVFRFRPKAHYRRRTGHRAELTRIRIDEIATPTGKTASAKGASARTASATAGPGTTVKRAPSRGRKPAAGDETAPKPRPTSSRRRAPAAEKD